MMNLRYLLIGGLSVLGSLSAFSQVTFTVSKADAVHPAGWAWYIGQTFSPEEQGPQGTGSIPASADRVTLKTFQVYPWAESQSPFPLPSQAFIYDAFDLPDFSDSIGTGPVMGVGSLTAGGVYDFGEGVALETDGFYLFIMEDAASVLYWQSSDYTGGEGYWTDASTVGSNLEIKPFNADIDFTATFEAVPEPSQIALMAVGALVIAFVFVRRRRLG
jgi:hypothetical protein